MEIAFLIHQQGSGEEGIIKTNLGVTAQTLRHLSILRDRTLTVSVFNMDITVPVPEAYVLHKMVINNQRGKKAEKDRAAIENLYPFIDKDRFDNLKGILTAKEKRLADNFIL